MAPHSSTLAWKIPWTEEPGGLQSMGLQRVGHNWVTSLSLFTFMHCRRQWHPTPVLLSGKIPGTGEPGGLLSMGSHRVGHDWSDLAAVAATAAAVPPVHSQNRSARILVRVNHTHTEVQIARSSELHCQILGARRDVESSQMVTKGKYSRTKLPDAR